MSATDLGSEMLSQSTTRHYVIALADQQGIRYQTTPADELADIATQLAGDEVLTDEIEDLIVALRRASVISRKEMVDLLGRYLTENLRA